MYMMRRADCCAGINDWANYLSINKKDMNLFKVLFYRFFKNIAELFNRYNLLWQLLAVVLTYIIVISNLDWIYFIYSRSPVLQGFFFPAIVMGGILPIIVPIVIYIVSRLKKDFEGVNIAGALGQGALIGLLFSSFYKSFTGRIPPVFFDGVPPTNISHGFQFGLLRGGVFWGWPSSHTTVAFAVVVVLIMLYPENKIIKYSALIYALYVGLAMSITVHWFSEFVAGAIFGTLIGIAVGRSFRERLKGF
jgi:membrane-associated phospholipid phosphatase